MWLNNKTETVIDLTNITHTVEFYFCVVICNIGFMANILNILVSTRKKLLKNTVGFYNIFMSIFNISTLAVAGYLDLFSQSIGQKPLILRSNLNCVLITYFIQVFSQMTAWLIVMVTADRLLCLYSLFNRFKFIKNKKNLSGTVACLFLVICFINLPSFFFHLDPQTGMCTSVNFVVLLRDLSAMTIRVIVPLVIQLIMNTILIYKLIQVRKNLRMTKSEKNEARLAFTSIILNGVLVVTELPFIVSTILTNVYGYNETLISHTTNKSAWASFAFVCSLGFASFYYVSLFFVNYLTNKLFRRECKNIYFGK